MVVNTIWFLNYSHIINKPYCIHLLHTMQEPNYKNYHLKSLFVIDLMYEI